jgi:hypothetical protein
MRVAGDKQRGAIRPEFDRSISIDFQGAKISSDTGFLVIRGSISDLLSILAARSPRLTIRDRPDIRIIHCFNCCARESIRWRQAMRTVMTPIT